MDNESRNEEAPISSFHLELMFLLREKLERINVTSKSKRLHEFSLIVRDKTKELTSRPTWPYQFWSSNVILDHEKSSETAEQLGSFCQTEDASERMPYSDHVEDDNKGDSDDKTTLQSANKRDFATTGLTEVLGNSLRDLKSLVSVVSRVFSPDNASTDITQPVSSYSQCVLQSENINQSETDLASEAIGDMSERTENLQNKTGTVESEGHGRNMSYEEVDSLDLYKNHCIKTETQADCMLTDATAINKIIEHEEPDALKQNNETEIENGTTRDEGCRPKLLYESNDPQLETSYSNNAYFQKPNKCKASKNQCDTSTESNFLKTSYKTTATHFETQQNQTVRSEIIFKDGTKHKSDANFSIVNDQACGSDPPQKIESDVQAGKNTVSSKEKGISSIDIQIESALSKPNKPSHFSINYDLSVEPTSALFAFMNIWLLSVRLKGADMVAYVAKTVHHIIEETLSELMQRYEIFAGSYVVATGSMAENTRILKPDEFDFMIALPILANDSIADLIYSQMGIEVEVSEGMKENLFRFKKDCLSVDKNMKFSLTNAILLDIFRNTVLNHLPPGWRILPESEIHSMRVFLKNQTLTFHLSCNGALDISVDVCFCLPLDNDRIESVRVADSFHAANLRYVKQQHQRFGLQLFTVITNNPLVCGRFYFIMEKEIFKQKLWQAKCYKLAKYVAHAFLPKLQKNNCPLCFDSIIPSFYLKTTLFYMSDYYQDEYEWDDKQLGNRLLEIFDILRHSLQCVAGHMSYYFVVNTSKMDYKMEFNPGDGTLKLGIGLDNIKPCNLPEIENILKTITKAEITEKIVSYWEYMETVPWTMGSLLEKLTKLLQFLKDTEMTTTLLYKRQS